MTLKDVLDHHFSGGKFEYKSYDHKKAIEEFSKSEDYEKSVESFSFFSQEYNPDKYQIPEEIREKYSYWRSGKIRTVEFTPTGSIRRIYIGAKYPVAFYEADLSGLRLV